MFFHSSRFQPSRRLLARLLSVFFCSTLIVIRPFSKLGGSTAFLALTIQELTFSVQGTLTQQLELTILNLIFGGLFGIGISSLGKYIASLPPLGSPLARTIPALFLALTTFVGGWTRSRLPRLAIAARISAFIAIFMLTLNPGTESHRDVLEVAGNFLWIVLVAALSSLAASMLLLRWTSPQFAVEVAGCLTSIHTCLQKSLDHASADVVWVRDHELHAKLLKQSIVLNETYRRSSFELGVGRIPIKSIKHLIGTVEHMRRELAWGMTRPPRLHLHTPDSIEHSFDVCVEKLGNAILDSLVAIRDVILACYDRPFPARSLDSEKVALKKAKAQLTQTLENTKTELQRYCDEVDMTQRVATGEVGFSEEIFDMCLFMISLLQMASESRHAIHVCEHCIILYDASVLRLWYPRFSIAWLGVSPSAIVLEERSLFTDGEGLNQSDTNLTSGETREGLAERTFDLSEDNMDFTLSLTKAKSRIPRRTCSIRFFLNIIYLLWNDQTSLRARLFLSKIIRAIQHSSHLRYAFKSSACTVLAIPAFMPDGSYARSWFQSWRAEWMIITYIWVLETNTGATWRVGYLRLSGTLLGAVYAYIGTLICGTNPYGIVALIMLADIPISYIVMDTSFPSLGVVGAVTLPPIFFTPYFSDQHVSTLSLAALRALMIAMGIIAALAVNSIFFPRHSRVMFLDGARRTLGILSQIYMELGRDLFQEEPTVSQRQMLTLELSARNSLHRMSLLIMAMNDELSLVPKPMKRYRQASATLQNILDILTGIRKIRENIPRHETVLAVAHQRREMVSCICICLFACEQVFGARQPLPQFLPSPRRALNNLTHKVKKRIHRAREESAGALGFSLIYAFAETEAMDDLVTALEGLQELCRQLFGTASWFDVGRTPLNTPMTMSVIEIPVDPIYGQQLQVPVPAEDI